MLTSVPMQGGMVMPMVSYHESDGKLHVMLMGDEPQLTPLLVSNPGDSFNPADPWFAALDPSAQGLAFSRRYGFMMDTSDPLPANTEIWIRKTSGPADLKFYSPTEPVFGTDGTTNAVYWNTVMWHPVAAAPPGTNTYTATFELYLVDTVSGQELTNTSTGPLVLDWTNMPDGRPALSLASKMVVAWPIRPP